MTTQNCNTDLDIMLTLLKTKENLDFDRAIQVEEGFQMIIQKSKPKNCDRRVGISSQVRFYFQRYLFNTATSEFLIGNKNHKNPLLKKMGAMEKKLTLVRTCLQKLSSGQIALFIIDKQKDTEGLFKDCLVEQKIPEDEVKNFEEKIYIRLYVEKVLNPLPQDPKKISEYPLFVKKYYEEVIYFIQNGFLKDAESPLNGIINKLVNMKKSDKVEFDKKENKEVKKNVLSYLKKLLLNRTYLLEKKPPLPNMDPVAGKRKDYEDAIKCITNDYFKFFKNDYDDSYLKISGRLCMYYLNTKQFTECENTLKNLETNCKNLPQYESVVKTIKESYVTTRNTANADYKKKAEKIIKESSNTLEDYEWSPSLQTEDLKEFLGTKALVMDNSIKKILNH